MRAKGSRRGWRGGRAARLYAVAGRGEGETRPLLNVRRRQPLAITATTTITNSRRLTTTIIDDNHRPLMHAHGSRALAAPCTANLYTMIPATVFYICTRVYSISIYTCTHICIQARGAQRRDSFAFLTLRASAYTYDSTLSWSSSDRRFVDLALAPRDSLVTSASRYRSLGQEPIRCPALRTHSERSPLLCATFRIRVPRDVSAKLRWRRRRERSLIRRVSRC